MKKIVCPLILVLLNVICISLSLAQESVPVAISPDRPSVGFGTDLVAPHYVSVENGTTWTRGGGVSLIDGTENLTRFGISRYVELRTSVPSTQWESDVRKLQLQDASFGAKIHLPSSAAWPIASIVNLSVPVGSRGVSSGGWDPSVLLATSHTLSPRLSFTASDNVSWVTNGAPGHILLSQMSVVPYWKLSGTTTAYAEYAPLVSRNPGGSGYTADSGVLWTVHDRLQFDVRGGNTLDRNGQNHLLIGAGFSFMVARR